MPSKIFQLVVITTIIRCIAAVLVNLGNDEVYYYTYAVHPQLNYFDHPPMVGWLIWLTTFNLSLNTEFFIRLGAIICSAINTCLVYKLARLVSNAEAGWMAAMLYTGSVYTSVIAGLFILPDSPQLTFWLWSMLLMVKIFSTEEITSAKKNNFLLLGSVIGLCIMCKVHGAFLWMGSGIFILLYNRKWLASPYLYMAFLLTLLIISPVLIWNFQNHLATVNYHGDRVNFLQQDFNLSSFFTSLGGQFFYHNPFIFILCFIALFRVKKYFFRSPFQLKLILCTALPLIIVTQLLSLFKNTLPHWSGPGYLGLMIISAVYLSQKRRSVSGFKTPLVIKASLIFILFIVIAGIGAINLLPLTLGKKEHIKLGSGDVTLDMYGWKKISRSVKLIYEKDTADKNIKQDVFILSNKWFPAAHLDFYVARPNHLSMQVPGNINDIHQYQWLNKYRKQLYRNADAYFITPSNNYYDPSIEFVKYFEKIDSAVVVPQYRNGGLVRYFFIYRCKGFKHF